MIDYLVLGIGSPFGDDQLGWRVVELLHQSPRLKALIPHRLQLTCCDRPGMQLLELMQPAHTVFLIDAVKTGAMPGTLHRFQNAAFDTSYNTLSTHGFGIAEALKIGAALEALPETLMVYGIEIAEVCFQATLSKPIAEAINALSALIESEVLGF